LMYAHARARPSPIRRLVIERIPWPTAAGVVRKKRTGFCPHHVREYVGFSVISRGHVRRSGGCLHNPPTERPGQSVRWGRGARACVWRIGSRQDEGEGRREPARSHRCCRN
jgi:hypothetical protein